MTVLLKREPWGLLGQLHHNLDEVLNNTRATSDTSAQWIPAVDIKEEDDKYLLHADIPGVDPKDIHLTIEQGYLTLKGQRKYQTADKKPTYQKTECQYGSFVRQFKLPDSVDGDAISAKGEYGVLKIIIPKTLKAEPRKILVTH